MNGFTAIYRRELLALWVTPLAWVLLVVFLILQGTVFYTMVVHFSTMAELSVDFGPVQAYFGQESIFLLLTLLLLCPALTMRLFAEEKKSGTIEPLLTAPVTPVAIVLGKYFATITTYVLTWAPTVLYVIILRKTGAVDWRVVGSSYLGLTSLGAGFLGVGTLMSAMTRSQLVALILTVGVLFGIFVLGIGEYIFDPGPLQALCAHVSVMSQMEEFSKGIVDLRRLCFDGTLTVLPLFMAVRVVDSWRWG